MLLLERLELAEERVVLVVADLRVVVDVVALRVVLDLAAQLVPAGARVGHSTSSAAGFSSRARSCLSRADMPVVSVRSKWSGVTAMTPAATAARSVPSSSWKSGASP